MALGAGDDETACRAVLSGRHSTLKMSYQQLGACTGSQLPLAMPRSDARQNLIDSLTCATAFFTPPHVLLQEVAICFGGRLMRGNRAQKASTHAALSMPDST